MDNSLQSTWRGYRISFLAKRFSTVPSSWRIKPSHGRTCSTSSHLPTSMPYVKIILSLDLKTHPLFRPQHPSFTPQNILPSDLKAQNMHQQLVSAHIHCQHCALKHSQVQGSALTAYKEVCRQAGWGAPLLDSTQGVSNHSMPLEDFMNTACIHSTAQHALTAQRVSTAQHSMHLQHSHSMHLQHSTAQHAFTAQHASGRH